MNRIARQIWMIIFWNLKIVHKGYKNSTVLYTNLVMLLVKQIWLWDLEEHKKNKKIKIPLNENQNQNQNLSEILHITAVIPDKSWYALVLEK